MGYLAAILNIGGWLVYFRAQFQGKTIGSAVGWWLATLMAAVCGWVFFKAGGSFYGSLFYFAGAVCCFIAGTYAFIKANRKIVLNTKQKIALFIATLSFVFAFSSPLLSIAFISLYYACTYFIMINSILIGQTRESPLPWCVWVTASSIHVWSQQDAGLALLLPATNLACWVALLLSSIHMRKPRDSYSV